MNKILIIGATSDIAESCARVWAMNQAEFFLVARDEHRANLIAKDLVALGASLVHLHMANLAELDSHRHILEEAFKKLGKVDIALISHGTLSEQIKCENSVELAVNEIYLNGITVISLLTNLANYFELQKSGVLAVISSVAGDKGRATNYVYGSAKSLVTTFCSGLRQRLFKHGVSVITIKPGLINTKMTAGLRKNFLWSQKESVAKLIVTVCKKKRAGEYYSPKFWYFIMLIIKIMPNFIFNRIKF